MGAFALIGHGSGHIATTKTLRSLPQRASARHDSAGLPRSLPQPALCRPAHHAFESRWGYQCKTCCEAGVLHSPGGLAHRPP
jgi:hypothetical protein